jgi:hypothetical protein
MVRLATKDSFVEVLVGARVTARPEGVAWVVVHVVVRATLPLVAALDDNERRRHTP